MTHTAAPARITLRHTASLRVGFVSGVFALVSVFATAGSTIPLFNIYRAEDGFSNAGISLTVVAYSAATLGALLVLGRLSGFVGRRPVALSSLGLLVLGCLLLLSVHDIGTLVAGRLLMGLGAGLASSSLPAYIVDTAPSRPHWLASVASSQTVMLGLAIGAVASGALVQYAPWPRDLIYVVVIVTLLASGALLSISPETVPRCPGAWSSLRPSVRVPARVRRLLPVAGAVFLGTWATGAFYQAFVPGLVQDQLGTRSPLILGLVFAAYMGPSALASPLGGLISPAVAQRIAMTTFLLGWVGIVASTMTRALPVFIAATIVAGASQGIAISASVRGLLHGSCLTDRAPIFAVIYLLSYSGATFPSLISGELSHGLPLRQIAVGYGVLTLITSVITVVAVREPTAVTGAFPDASRRHGTRR